MRRLLPMDPTSGELELSVSDFVALHNQVLEYAMPSVTIVGELANFRVSKNRWVYFDLKDEFSSVRFFGTVYALSGPLEDGMLLRVHGQPRVHPQYGFSVNVMTIQPAGEGTLRRAFDLLQAKLTAEGLFEPERKRLLPYPPERIGVITSKESAAYADFMKILGARWGGLEVTLADVQVQGDAAPAQIVQALQDFNALAEPLDVLILTRGGGSADDLWAFNTEQVTRAVAASRIPTLVAIGHEVDISLAELAADQRASTPSNAAELLTPDRREVTAALKISGRQLGQGLQHALSVSRESIRRQAAELRRETGRALERQRYQLQRSTQMLELLNPAVIVRRGYAIVRDAANGKVIRATKQTKSGQLVDIQLSDGNVGAEVQ
jgi:exodeoxyribonuclease VII large subunit